MNKWHIVCPNCNHEFDWVPCEVKVLVRCPLCVHTVAKEIAKKLKIPEFPLGRVPIHPGCDFNVKPLKKTSS